MEHDLIERYSGLNSFIHRLDSRLKLLATLGFVLAVVTTSSQRWPAFAFYFTVVAILVMMSRVPPLYVVKRSLVILPFVVVIAIFLPFFEGGEAVASFNLGPWQISVSRHGLIMLTTVVVKAWLSVLSLILLSATTRVPQLFKGLEQLRLPRIMVMTIAFTYRYIFVLVDEAMRLKRARDSRNFGGKRLWQLKVIGNMVGTLFLRSYERGERVYQAMLARGYEGQVRLLEKPRLGRLDLYFGIAFLACLLAISLGTLTLW